MTRWILSTQEYDFNIKHCKGKDVVTKILSRNPDGIDSAHIENTSGESEMNSITLQISKECRKI